MPALSQAREKARRIRCLNNLKQIGFGIAMYADIYTPKCPDTGGGSGSLAAPYFNFLWETGGLARLFACPSDTAITVPTTFSDSMATSYGYNAGLRWGDLNVDSITVLDALGGVTSGPVPPNTPWDATSPHKSNRGNVLYVDGRAEFKTATPTLMPSYHKP